MALMLLAWPQTTEAQTALKPGDRVRVTAAALGPNALDARVVSARADSLFLRRGEALLGVPNADLLILERWDGRHGHARRGMWIGALAVTGFLAEEYFRNPQQCEGSGNYRQLCLLFGSLTVVGGALVGTAVGALIRHDTWVSLTVEPEEVGSGRPRVWRIGFSIRLR